MNYSNSNTRIFFVKSCEVFTAAYLNETYTSSTIFWTKSRSLKKIYEIRFKPQGRYRPKLTSNNLKCKHPIPNFTGINSAFSEIKLEERRTGIHDLPVLYAFTSYKICASETKRIHKQLIKSNFKTWNRGPTARGLHFTKCCKGRGRGV